MEDSNMKKQDNSGHYYMECSNKGQCDRSAGECVCFDGYDGVACQRASCPGYPSSCSGHGVCKSKKQLAKGDSYNVYRLWDHEVTMGCDCDAGYFGADCAERMCKSGIDPLYFDDIATVKHATWNFAVLTTAVTGDFTDGHAQAGTGHYAIRVFDTQGEDWLTSALPASATCEDIVAALEAIPNNVIPSGTAICHQEVEANYGEQSWHDDQENLGNVGSEGAHIEHVGGLHNKVERHRNRLNFWDARSWDQLDVHSGVVSGSIEVGHTDPMQSLVNGKVTLPVDGVEKDGVSIVASTQYANVALSGSITRIAFYGNPGAVKEPEIEIYLDGKRPSLSSTGKLITKVWTDGQQGESNDYFGDHCDGVTVRLNKNAVAAPDGGSFWIGGLTPKELSMLKKCLGDSDFDTSNNVDVQNWDHGTMYYPHIIKLVRSVTSHNDGGYYAAIWFDPTVTWQCAEGTFRLVNPMTEQTVADPMAGGVGSNDYDVYTTQGTLALTSNYSQATFSLGTNNIYTTSPEYDIGMDDTTLTVIDHKQFDYDGDISCEIGQHNAYKMKYIFHCLNKTDMFTVLNWGAADMNPPHINLYTAARLYTAPAEWSVGDRVDNDDDTTPAKDSGNAFFRSMESTVPLRDPSRRLHGFENDAMAYMTHVVNTDISTNWAAVSTWDQVGWPFFVYKFFPARASTYNYVGECSNRGLCNRDSGVCSCFPGYTNDDCSVQDAISM